MPTRSMTVETYENGVKVATDTVTYEVSDEQVNEEQIREQAAAALEGNRAYIGRTSPTAAQTTAQVKALSQQNNRIIRLLLGLLDGTD